MAAPLNYLHCVELPSLLCHGGQGTGRGSMWATVNETFRAGFKTGFLLTHRPSLHKAASLGEAAHSSVHSERDGTSSGPSLLMAASSS